MSTKPGVFPLAIANSFPELPYLALGMVAAHLRAVDDGSLARRFNIHRLVLGGVEGYPLDAVLARIAADPAPVCLFSSYVWNHAENLALAAAIREGSPGAFIIFGGPEVPKYDGETESFLREHPAVDVAVLGEGEVSCGEILSALGDDHLEINEDFHSINGIVFRDGDRIVRTAARERITDINTLPSPYLTGEYGDWFQEAEYTVIETNRGCPYGCTYCDWGSATLQKVTKFSPERVIRELEFIAGRRSQSVFIADANFGMLEQDIEIARALVDIRAATGYPKRLYTNFAKNGGRRLMQVIKILHEGGLLPTGIIALQTTDPHTLETIARDNIKTSTYERMMEYFSAEGIPMATDIMIGLPGQTVDSLQGDLQFCFNWKVSANGNFTSMMPNAPMAERSYREANRIEVDDNGLIASTSTFTRDDMAYMRSFYKSYQFHVRLGLMKYVLYHLQVEHGIAALALLRRWVDRVMADDPALPLGGRVFRELLVADQGRGDWSRLSWGDEAAFLFEDLEAYVREFLAFAADEYGIDLPSQVAETLVSSQAAVSPRPGRDYPYTVRLAHDITAYFEQIKSAPSLDRLDDGFRPLKAFSSGNLRVTPKVVRKSFKFLMIDGHADAWEYRSPLRFY